MPLNNLDPTPREAGELPRTGFYECPLVKGGEPAPCAILYGPPRDPETKQPLDRSWWWTAYECGKLVGGRWRDPTTGRLLDDLANESVYQRKIAVGEPTLQPSAAAWRIWEYGQPITPERYALLLQQHAWDKEHDPTAPLANPRKPVDLRAMRPAL